MKCDLVDAPRGADTLMLFNALQSQATTRELRAYHGIPPQSHLLDRVGVRQEEYSFKISRCAAV
jgi:Ni,Fe-hydrogenase III small subunit